MKFFRVPFNHDEDSASTQKPNKLHEYIQSQSMQDMTRLASEISPQVKQIIAGNVQALLGYLPGQEFQTTVAAEKSSFQNLLASAMVTGYFMHAMENRMKMESLFTGDKDAPSPEVRESASEAPSTGENFGPEVPPSFATAVEPEVLDPEQQMQQALQRLMQARLEEGTRRKAPLKKPEDLFGALIERHLKEIEQLDEADRLGDFVSGEALRKITQSPPSSPDPVPAKMQDTVKIQLEINTEMGQKALTDLLRAMGTMGHFEKE